jgi:hypothetical protein
MNSMTSSTASAEAGGTHNDRILPIRMSASSNKASPHCGVPPVSLKEFRAGGVTLVNADRVFATDSLSDHIRRESLVDLLPDSDDVEAVAPAGGIRVDHHSDQEEVFTLRFRRQCSRE